MNMTQLLIVVGLVLGLLVEGFAGLLVGGALGWIAGLLLELRDRLDEMEDHLKLRQPPHPQRGHRARPRAASGRERPEQRYPEQSVIDHRQDRSAEEAAAEFDRYYNDVSRPRD